MLFLWFGSVLYGSLSAVFVVFLQVPFHFISAYTLGKKSYVQALVLFHIFTGILPT